MIPFYTEKDPTCEQCDADLFIGYEVVYHDRSFFCDRDCLSEFLIENTSYKEVFLTKEKVYREVD